MARPIVMTLLLTGLRKENVLTLDIRQNLRWDERQIIVRQKGDTNHVIGMSDDLYHLLRDVCGERTRGPVFVFGINGCDCMHCAEFTKQKAVSVPRRVRCVETGEVFNSAAEAVRKMKAAGHSGVNANQIGVICRGGKAKGGSNRDGTPKEAFYTVTTSGGFCWEYAAPLAQPAVKKQPNKQRKTGRIKSIDGTFNTARKQIGRPELRIHDLRHTFGTWLNARGTDVNKIKDLMGHADIISTQRYLHVGVDEGREELNKNIRFNISAPRE
jgi:integrase